jgi:hypothetical protein
MLWPQTKLEVWTFHKKNCKNVVFLMIYIFPVFVVVINETYLIFPVFVVVINETYLIFPVFVVIKETYLIFPVFVVVINETYLIFPVFVVVIKETYLIFPVFVVINETYLIFQVEDAGTFIGLALDDSKESRDFEDLSNYTNEHYRNEKPMAVVIQSPHPDKVTYSCLFYKF